MKKNTSPLIQGFVWGGCFTITAAVSAFLGTTVALKTPLPVDIRIMAEKINDTRRAGLSGLLMRNIDRPVNILLMGIDQVPNSEDNPELKFSGRSDTMLLVRVNPKDSSIKVLSIPRDSLVRYPRGTLKKINSANANGGVDYTIEVIENNFAGITVDKYIRVTSTAFSKIIDTVGGVEVYVPFDMKYTDKTQGLYIDLKQGKQNLDGNKAEQFVRYRSDGLGDIGRIQRQQVLLKALQKKLQSPLNAWRTPRIWSVLQDEIDTNLTNSEVVGLASFSLGLEKQNLRMLTLPGRGSRPGEYNASYWIIDRNKKANVIEEFIDSSSVSTNSRLALGSRIAVQNSTDNPQLSQKFISILSEQGYRNVYQSGRNLPRFETTQIIVQKGDSTSAKQVQKSLGFGELEYSSTGDLSSDITIVLGEDAIVFID